MIKINNLSKSYNAVFAIDKVSLNLNEGEIYGFIGPNGAGKSTTIKALLNYILPDKGSATINGLDIVCDNEEIKKIVGYVSSEVNFYPEFTAIELIKLAMNLHGINDTTYMEHLLKLFIIEKDKKIKAMSLGNKKKVSIVAALVLDTPILILDEPTSGLDPLMQNVLFKELKDMASKGKTIFVSSHNLKEVQDHCDRVAFIKNGKIIQVISISEKLKEGKYVRIKGDVKALSTLNKVVLMEKNNEMSFIYTDDIEILIKTLSNIHVDNLIIDNLSLEHQFLEYYNEGEN